MMLDSPNVSNCPLSPGAIRRLPVHLRGISPESLPGRDFDSLMYGKVNFSALDQGNQATRIQLDSTVIRVEHTRPSGDHHVEVTYEKGGALFKNRARTVVMASGGWVNKHILADMPEDLARLSNSPATRRPLSSTWRCDSGVSSMIWVLLRVGGLTILAASARCSATLDS